MTIMSLVYDLIVAEVTGRVEQVMRHVGEAYLLRCSSRGTHRSAGRKIGTCAIILVVLSQLRRHRAAGLSMGKERVAAWSKGERA